MHIFDKKIKKMNNTEDVLKALLEALGYDKSPNFHYTENDENYDAEYIMEIENKSYTLIGVKVIKENDEKMISALHLKYWNRNDVPFSILVLPNEIRIYNNFTITFI